MAMHIHGASMFVRQAAHHRALAGGAGVTARHQRERRGQQREDEGERLNAAHHLYLRIKYQSHTNANTIGESCCSEYALTEWVGLSFLFFRATLALRCCHSS